MLTKNSNAFVVKTTNKYLPNMMVKCKISHEFFFDLGQYLVSNIRNKSNVMKTYLALRVDKRVGDARKSST